MTTAADPLTLRPATILPPPLPCLRCDGAGRFAQVDGRSGDLTPGPFCDECHGSGVARCTLCRALTAVTTDDGAPYCAACASDEPSCVYAAPAIPREERSTVRVAS